MKMRKMIVLLIGVIFVGSSVVPKPSRAGLTQTVDAKLQAAETPLANMPVKEITVFKDGHAFVLHEGLMPVNNRGNVVLDYLPRPIIGTFWAYTSDPRAQLSCVTTEQRVVSIDHTALTVPELIEANIGKKVQITDNYNKSFQATILRVPARDSDELDRTNPPNTPDQLPQKSQLVLLQVDEGVKVMPLDRIQQITFLETPQSDFAQAEFRPAMTLKLDWTSQKPSAQANVGLFYVEKGIRWIPGYRVEIDGQGNALLKLQATLVNELADLQDVKAHLVIGVPRFKFEDTVDPVSLQQTVARLSNAFRSSSRSAYAYSNAIASQVAGDYDEMFRSAEGAADRQAAGLDLGPEVSGSDKNEDLFVFTLDHVTLKKGARMVVPLAEYKLTYQDVYKLNIPFAPPPEVRYRFNGSQQAELAKLFSKPKVKHYIRMKNNGEYPITTAPALILRDGRLIAQGMTKYTAIGAQCDLELTTAVDITLDLKDLETNRQANAANWGGHSCDRFDLAGAIALTNHLTKTIDLEVARSILGNIDDANQQGEIEQIGGHGNNWMAENAYPYWWHWYNWPYWWYRFNTIGRVNWKIQLEPDQKLTLQYNWHYFWDW